jgi:hypothetical protein
MEQTNSPVEIAETSERQNRREVVRKLGRFAAYAAPFTIMAMSSKVQAVTAGGPGPHSRPAGSSH